MVYFADIFGLGAPELLIILAIILLLFGSRKLPELFRNAGRSVRELRLGMDGGGKDGDKHKKQSKPDDSSGS